MYTKHFLKMFIGLICMAVIGFVGLMVVDHYSKGNDANPQLTKIHEFVAPISAVSGARP